MHQPRAASQCFRSSLLEALEQPTFSDATRSVQDLLSLLRRTTAPVERAQQWVEVLVRVRDAQRVEPAIVPELITCAPTSDLRALVSVAARAGGPGFDAVLQHYVSMPPGERKEQVYRGLLNAFVQDRQLANGVDLERLAACGLRTTLHLHHVPLEKNQGFGLCTDLYLMSQLHLARVGQVSFLPLPDRFPTARPVTARGIADGGDRGALLQFLGLEHELRFGRSARFRTSASDSASPLRCCVLKAARGVAQNAHAPELTKLRFEAEMMGYLARFRSYFGLESALPIPARGPGNRIHVWRLSGVDHLKYAAEQRYFTYLEDATSADELRQALLRNVSDLMRLARFGIFHPELAPVFHDAAGERPYRWNIGGFQPGAGRLAAWERGFSYANMRMSGLADFEHLIRYRKLPAVAELTTGFSQAPEPNLQFLLGNSMFCALHIAGLWYRRRNRFDEDASTLHQTVEELFATAHLSFTGTPWHGISRDIDVGQIVREMQRFMGARPGEEGYFAVQDGPADLGPRNGAYPAHELIKALTAFTLRAIPAFVANRAALRRELPKREPDQVPEFFEVARHPFPGLSLLREEIDRFVRTTAGALTAYGIPATSGEEIAYALRGRDVRGVRCQVGSALLEGYAARLAPLERAIRSVMKGALPPDGLTRIRENAAPYQMPGEIAPSSWVLLLEPRTQ